MSHPFRPFSGIRPNSPSPPEASIEAARHDVPPTLADMENTSEYGVKQPEPGERIVPHYRLVQELTQKRQHGKTAAEWAIDRLVEQGMLTIHPGCSSTPGVIGRDGAWLMAPITYQLHELKYCLIQSTPRLWAWWREQHEDKSKANATRGICEARTAISETWAKELPLSLEQMRDWLAERVRWLRDWHLSAVDPKPLAPGLVAAIVRLFRSTSCQFPSDPTEVPKWASLHIWLFSEYTAHQAHASLERMGILDAPAWPSPDIENDMRALIVALDHLAALLSFVAQRLASMGSPSSPNGVSALPTPSVEKAEHISTPVAATSTFCHKKTKSRHERTKPRDKWIYQQCCKGTPYDAIVAQLKRIAVKRKWRIVSTKQRIQQIGIEYAQANGLPLPPSRQNL